MRSLEISEESYEKIKDQLKIEERQEINDLGDLVGKSFFFRTVTYHLVGKVEKIIGQTIELSAASWVADSGRFTQAINDGVLNEVEPVGQAFLNFSTVTDFFPWKHMLPTKQK